jgi:signal transduction histidine kinase
MNMETNMESLRVLLIEDNPGDARLIWEMLQGSDSGSTKLVHASGLSNGLAKLEHQPFDVLLLDLGLPDSYGLDTFLAAQIAAPYLAIVVLTGNSDEAYALQAVQAGAQDYLVKGEVNGRALARAIRYAAERKQIAQELYQAKQEAEVAARFKSDFLAGMSHELRTPLTSILGFTEVLLMKLPGPLTPDQEKHLNNVDLSAKHLLLLINDLLDIAKIESGKREISMESMSCRHVIEEVASLMSPLAHKKGVHFDARLPSTEITVNSDRRLLTQIILNLCHNAIKFTQQGKVCVELAQQHVNGQRTTKISVVDTGVGIRLEDQAKLFESFTQVSTNDKQLREGTGLGLNLSQKLAQLIGGQIVFQSEYRKGSTFTLTIAEK